MWSASPFAAIKPAHFRFAPFIYQAAIFLRLQIQTKAPVAEATGALN